MQYKTTEKDPILQQLLHVSATLSQCAGVIHIDGLRLLPTSGRERYVLVRSLSS